MIRRKVQKQTKLGAAIIAILLLFLTMAPLSSSAAETQGSLKLHKLSSVGVKAGMKDDNKVYYQSGDLFYEYVAGAEYTIYKIGTFGQTVDGGVASVTYKPINGLKNIDNEPINTIDSKLTAASIDITTAGTPVGEYGPTTAAGPLEIEGLDTYSVYLIKETNKPAGVEVGNDFIITIPMYDKAVQEWSYKVDAFPKNIVNKPYIKKTISNGGTEEIVYYANVGDTIDYKVTVTAPADIDNKTYQDFRIVDSYSKNLLIDNNTSFTINGKRYEDGSTYSLAEPVDYSFTYDSGKGEMTITLTAEGIEKVGNKDTLEISYGAKITGAINTSGGGIVNSAKLILEEQEINPDQTIDPNPIVYIYSYGVKKVNENDDALADAKFVLATKEGSVYTYLNFNEATSEWTSAVDKENATTFISKKDENANSPDKEAILQFINLNDEKTYYLFEVSSPDGYQRLENPVEIKAAIDTTQAVYASYNSEGNYQTGVAGTIGYTTAIKNIFDSDYPGSLPSTGGSGIYMFIIIGAALISFAIFLLVKSKKNNNKKD